MMHRMFDVIGGHDPSVSRIPSLRAQWRVTGLFVVTWSTWFYCVARGVIALRQSPYEWLLSGYPSIAIFLFMLVYAVPALVVAGFFSYWADGLRPGK